jgi:hypothetical protein
VVPVRVSASHVTELFGHAGGFSWDEALLVMAPIVIIAALLVLANRRAARLQSEQPAPARPDDEQSPDGS